MKTPNFVFNTLHQINQMHFLLFSFIKDNNNYYTKFFPKYQDKSRFY